MGFVAFSGNLLHSVANKFLLPLPYASLTSGLTRLDAGCDVVPRSPVPVLHFHFSAPFHCSAVREASPADILRTHIHSD